MDIKTRMRKTNNTIDSETLCNCIVEGMQENKAKDVVILDLREVSGAVTDFFVICTGESTAQVDGIGNSVVRTTRTELQQKPWHQEGKTTSEWVLLDYIDVVVHVFYKETRKFYDLEELWADAKRTDVPNID